MSLKNIVKGTVNRSLKEVGVLNENTVTLGDSRLAICKSCDTFKASNNTCDSNKGGCGCYMKSKVLVKEASCPKDKW